MAAAQLLTGRDTAINPSDPRDVIEQRLRQALIDDLDHGFGELVRVHQAAAYAVARHVSHRSIDAEDLTAESLLRGYKALRSYDADRIATLSIRPWLLTIVRNTARNAMRDASRRPAPPPMFEPLDHGSDAAGPEKLAEQADVQRGLRLVLAQLPEVQRSAVVLRHVVGLPTSEVAEVLDCRVGTAKSHISRGLQRLRKLMTAGTIGSESPPTTTRIRDDSA